MSGGDENWADDVESMEEDRHPILKMSKLDKEWMSIYDTKHGYVRGGDGENYIEYHAKITIQVADIPRGTIVPRKWKELPDDYAGRFGHREKSYPDGYGKIEYSVKKGAGHGNKGSQHIGYVSYRNGELEASTIDFKTLGLTNAEMRVFDHAPYKSSDASVQRLRHDQFDGFNSMKKSLQEYVWKMKGVGVEEALERLMAGSFRGVKITKYQDRSFDEVFIGTRELGGRFVEFGMRYQEGDSMVDVKAPDSRWDTLDRTAAIYYLLDCIEPLDLEKELYDILKYKFELIHGPEPPKRPAPGIRLPSPMILPPVKDTRPLEDSRPPKDNPPRGFVTDSDVVLSDDDDDSDADSVGSESSVEDSKEKLALIKREKDASAVGRAINYVAKEANLHKFVHGNATVDIFTTWVPLGNISESQIHNKMVVFPVGVNNRPETESLAYHIAMKAREEAEAEAKAQARAKARAEGKDEAEAVARVLLPKAPSKPEKKIPVAGYTVSLITDSAKAFPTTAVSKSNALEKVNGSDANSSSGHMQIWKNKEGKLLIPDGYGKIRFGGMIPDFFVRFEHGNIIVSSSEIGYRGMVTADDYWESMTGESGAAFKPIKDLEGNATTKIEFLLGSLYRDSMKLNMPQVNIMKRAKPKTRRMPTLSRHRGKHGRSGRDYDNDDD